MMYGILYPVSRRKLQKSVLAWVSKTQEVQGIVLGGRPVFAWGISGVVNSSFPQLHGFLSCREV